MIYWNECTEFGGDEYGDDDDVYTYIIDCRVDFMDFCKLLEFEFHAFEFKCKNDIASNTFCVIHCCQCYSHWINVSQGCD